MYYMYMYIIMVEPFYPIRLYRKRSILLVIARESFPFFSIHKLLSYLRETQIDPETSLVDHVVLVLDTMDMDDAEDFRLTEK